MTRVNEDRVLRPPLVSSQDLETKNSFPFISIETKVAMEKVFLLEWFLHLKVFSKEYFVLGKLLLLATYWLDLNFR